MSVTVIADVSRVADGDIVGPFDYKGPIDCSGNPNYPAADAGDVYVVQVAGKIGGASGPNVDVKEQLICRATTAGGTHAAVGANWNRYVSDIPNPLDTADIGVLVQAQDPDLTAIAALTSAADKLPYATGTGAWAMTDLPADGRAVINIHSTKLAAIGALTWAANKMLYLTGAATAAVADLTVLARSLLAASTVEAMAGVLASSYVAGKGGAASANGSLTTEEIARTVSVPALGANSMVTIRAVFECTENAGVKTARVRFGAPGAGAGGSTLTSVAMTNLERLYVDVRFMNQGLTNSQVAVYGVTSAGTSGTSSSAVPSFSVDTSAGIDIVFTTTKDNAADSFVLRSYMVEVHP